MIQPLPVNIVRIRKRPARRLQAAFVHRHQPAGIRIGERLQQSRIHKTEDGHADAHAKSQHEDRCGSKAGILYQLASREPDITHEIVEPRNPALPIEALLRRSYIAERDLRPPVCFLFAQAFTLKLIGFEFQMCLDLLGEIIGAALAPEHGYASSPLGPALAPRIDRIAVGDAVIRTYLGRHPT